MGKGVRRLIFWLVCVCLLGLTFAFLIPALTNTSHHPPHQRCCNNLKQVGLALRMYAGDNGEKFPGELADLGRYLGYQSSVFICPASDREGDDIKIVDDWTDYVYIPGLSESLPSDTVLLYCPARNHGWEFGNVVFVNGAVRSFKSVTSKEFSAKESSFEDVIATIREQGKP